MKPKMILKISIDLVMTVLLLFQMAYMFLKTRFVFFDMQQPLISFLTEYLAMMGLWACLANYLSRGIQRLSVKN